MSVSHHQVHQKATVVVTGAASGIGRSIVTKLTAKGLTVIGVDVDVAGLQRLAEDIPSIVTIDGDVADRHTLERAANIAEDVAPLVGWVNNAAVFPAERSLLHETTRADLSRIIDVDLVAVIEGVRIAVERFIASGTSGAVVNMSSIHARRGYVGWSAYDIAKAGVEGLTRSASVEYGPYGIRVNAVAPALVTVESWFESLSALPEAEARRRTDQAADDYPLRRLASPDEVADAVLYLLDDQAAFVTGAILPVDGGFSVYAKPV